jgi:hypothetical protein
LAVVQCEEDPEAFAQRIRRIMKLKPTASVAPKLLTRTMLMSQYLEVLGYYQRLKAQLDRPNISLEDHGDGSTTPTSPVAESAPLPTEAPTAVPFVASSSAPASVPPEAPTDAAGPGQPANPAAVYATRGEIAALKRLAARVGAEAAEDLQDVLDHAPKGLVPDLYQRIEAWLQARLNGQKAGAVA